MCDEIPPWSATDIFHLMSFIIIAGFFVIVLFCCIETFVSCFFLLISLKSQ